MPDPTLLAEWLESAVRWLHVITAIAWIGSSFYFIALDLGLHRDRNLASGADGEQWQVHGGGFYHIQKYLVAPERMPGDLVWFKWESYATWLSGFAMLCLVYYLRADLFLIDPQVAELTRWQAILISLASLAAAWLVYDVLCRSPLGQNPTLLMVVLYLVLIGFALFYANVFTGRAALLHLGGITATIMSANVFLVIIPNQKIVVADLIAGRIPDARYGKIAKLRSTHNNYLTLPVLFMMLSNHYPLAFATQWNWAIASLVFLMGVTIRHWFNSRHGRRGSPWWTWAATLLLFLCAAWLSAQSAAPAELDARLSPVAARFAAAPGFDEVIGIVQGNCTMCHAAEPGYAGITRPPKGVVLETPEQIAGHARQIFFQAGASRAMPPPAASFIAPEDRARIVAWYRAATGADG